MSYAQGNELDEHVKLELKLTGLCVSLYIYIYIIGFNKTITI